MNRDPCRKCPLDPSRRDFVRDAVTAAVGALLLAGVPAELAARITPTPITPLGRDGNDPSYPIPAADGVSIDKKNEVILVRWQNMIYSFNLSCPHQNTALKWNDGHSEFQCPKHHSRYKPDGTFIDGRATRNMDRFSMTRSGETVIVHVDQMHKNDVDAPGWTGAVVRVG